MPTQSRTLNIIASKLGLAEETKVLSKAAELERLLQTKSLTGSNITDTSKTVLCLDLAASLFGIEFDVKTAVKYSGLKGPTYNNSKKTVENLLELNSDKLTINTLCISLQCGEDVQALAGSILEEYRKSSKMEIDLKLPQYVCMAVHQACRLSKVKVAKSKLIEKSRLKPSQWTKLEADWTKFVDEKFTTVKKTRGRPVKTSVVEGVQEDVEMLPIKPEPMEPKIEAYEDWKKRILTEAYKELKELNSLSETKIAPRRSPRKTPQKYAPYKSPARGVGVRLLFPTESL